MPAECAQQKCCHWQPKSTECLTPFQRYTRVCSTGGTIQWQTGRLQHFLKPVVIFLPACAPSQRLALWRGRSLYTQSHSGRGKPEQPGPNKSWPHISFMPDDHPLVLPPRGQNHIWGLACAARLEHLGTVGCMHDRPCAASPCTSTASLCKTKSTRKTARQQL